MAKQTKYGRQIFLSRDEIGHLRNLVDMDMMNQADELSWVMDREKEKPDDVFYKEQRREAEKAQRINASLERKLWYYLTPEESAKKQAAEGDDNV